MPLQETDPGLVPQTCILLVEDSPDDAFFFQRTLGKTGIPCVVRHVTDGAAAIELFRGAMTRGDRMPDAVFLDLKMPILNGFEVLEWVRQQPWAGSLPVTVLSGSNQAIDRERAAKLGASGYMVKPITSQDLAQQLESLSPQPN